MTVAAVILATTPDSALADADGTPAVRRLADAAWAGGATPVVVCCPDPSGDVGRALANAEVTLVDPAAEREGEDGGGATGSLAVGTAAAVALVSATDAVLVWPIESAWVDAETVTALIAAHGEDRRVALQAAYGARGGWPLLLPGSLVPRVSSTAKMSTAGLLDALVRTGAGLRIVDTGDPGVVHDIATPRSELPPFDGPPRPVDAHAHEWGAATADVPDEVPAGGPGHASRTGDR